MTNERLQVIGFFILFGILGLVAAFMWWPYLKLIALAVILAVLFMPVQKKIAGNSGHEIMATWATILLILFIIMVPLYLIGQLAFNELEGVYRDFREGGFSIDRSAIIQSLPSQLQSIAERLTSDLSERFSNLASDAFNRVNDVLANVASFFLAFFLVFFTIYYFLRDRVKIKEFFNSVLPLSKAHENLLVTRLGEAVNGVVKGMFLVALVQGVVATVGYLIFQVPSPFLWGSFTVLAALVPTVGTSIALIPAVLFLLLSGHTGAAIGLAIWGAVAVGLVDNVLSPKLVGAQVKLHPVLVLFSVLGGLQLFGFFGFLLGPIIMAMFMALLDIYRSELKVHLEK